MAKVPLTSAEKSKRYRDKKRAEKAAKQTHTISFEVSTKELETLKRLGVLRAGIRAPYEPSEYAVTLLRSVLPIDEAKYNEQAKSLGTCGYCNEELPKGCGGAFKGQTECYHTAKYKELELSRVTLVL